MQFSKHRQVKSDYVVITAPNIFSMLMLHSFIKKKVRTKNCCFCYKNNMPCYSATKIREQTKFNNSKITYFIIRSIVLLNKNLNDKKSNSPCLNSNYKIKKFCSHTFKNTLFNTTKLLNLVELNVEVFIIQLELTYRNNSDMINNIEKLKRQKKL